MLNYNYKTKGYYRFTNDVCELTITNEQVKNDCIINTNLWSIIFDYGGEIIFECFDIKSKKKAETIFMNWLESDECPIL